MAAWKVKMSGCDDLIGGWAGVIDEWSYVMMIIMMMVATVMIEMVVCDDGGNDDSDDNDWDGHGDDGDEVGEALQRH